MKKIVLGVVLALVATMGAVYAYRTIQVNANRGDKPFTFICPLSGKPIGHFNKCTSEDKAEAAEHQSCSEKAEHTGCCKKAEQAIP